MVGTGMDQTKTNQTQQKWSYIFGSYTCWDFDDDELFIKMHNLPFRPVIIAIIISGSEMLHERLLCVDVRLWMEVESNRIESNSNSNSNSNSSSCRIEVFRYF